MGQIWYHDDVRLRVQHRFLETIFPLAICAISLVVILAKTLRHFWRNDHDEEGRIRLPDGDEEQEDLTLQTTRSHATHTELDKPKAETGIVTFELALLLGQVAISIVSCLYDKRRPTYTSVSYLAFWTFLSALALLRLYITAVRLRSFLHLWNASAIIYGFEWFFEVFLFRSAIIHPKSTLSRNLIIARFAITTALSLLVLTTRQGNAPVEVEVEDDIKPSREPLSSLLGTFTFAWCDGLIWQGWKRPLEMSDVWNVDPRDKAELVFQEFRQIKKTHMLALRLLLYFKREVLVQGAWCAMSSVFMFMPTLLLKAILEYLEDPTSISANSAWLYVILLFITGLFQALGDGQSLWIGRKVCIRIRAVIIGEIYSKVLLRKAAASAEEPKKEEPERQLSWWQKIRSWTRKDADKARKQLAEPKKPTEASNGTVINLMSIDSFKVSEICAYLHFLWAATPVQLVMAVALLYKVLGYSSFVGIVLMVFVLPLNMWIAKAFTRAQKRIMAATDGRIHATNEVLTNIRIIKYFAWEQRFEDNVNEKRKIELQALWGKYILWSSAATIWSGVPILITFISFLVFTKVEQRPLIPSIAFPALSMFGLLRIPLDQLADMVAHVQESKVSVDRVEAFLGEEETEKYVQLRKSRNSNTNEGKIALRHATLSHSTTVSPDGTTKADGFRLIDMNVEFAVGKLNVIAGATGSGKTSLLLALLGEMKLLSGEVWIPGGFSRQMLRPDRSGLTESVAYCAQQAWLINATIKENVLFAAQLDTKRYNQVIHACGLKRDLEILDAGDQTLVGEKGITMSGGQKQRISLARALYSNSKHLMLDDCLSAVDSHTAKHIFEHAIQGPLMQNRTCILVSHNVALTIPRAEHVVVLNNGKIHAQGTPQDIVANGNLGDELARSVPASRVGSVVPSREQSRSPPAKDGQDTQTEPIELANDPENLQNTVPIVQSATVVVPNDAVQDKENMKPIDPRIESKATGSVKIGTIKMYLRAMGPWYYWILAIAGFVAVQIGSVATNVWIRQWANAYHTSSATSHNYAHNFAAPAHHGHGVSGSVHMQAPQHYRHHVTTKEDQVDSTYYLLVYGAIGLVYIFICLSRELLLFWGSQRASWTIHQRLLTRITRATFRFFDSTPLGQLTNRFSKDIQAVDQEVAPVAIGLLHSAASVVTVVVLISVITPGFLIPGFFIALIYLLTGMFYINSSRDLKRIESVQRSPLFQHFGETLSGVTTIRAYGDESRFVQATYQKVNTHNRPFIYLWATNRWLAFRVDCASALVAFSAAMFVVMNVGKIDAGAAGLSLSYAITFTQNVLWLIRLYAANEQNMNAVERVQEYIEVEQEAAQYVPEKKPRADWPSKGAVEFIDYSTRYRSDLDPVLRNISFNIAAGEKVGIVGRTGAGKSSLALALFRGLEAETGRILIDDVKIGDIGLQDLREAITIVPQDPTLFTGTLRSNLDPFGLFKDEEIYTALRRVQLITGSAENESSVPSPTMNGHSNASTLVGAPKLPSDSQHSPEGPEDLASSSQSDSSTLAPVTTQVTNTASNKNIFYDLSTPIAESGSNLSQGQRQLLCLARALLKSPKVLVMDEATASIDYATDNKIQDTLRELKDNTIITIAHRLQTIIDYDKVLVLDKGEVKEYAHPWELIRKDGGIFRSMCETSGDMAVLTEGAKKAWEGKRLINVED